MAMRFLFSLALLVFALAYVGYGLYTLTLIDTAGRLGPGFFPAMVGVLLVLTTATNCVTEYRRQQSEAMTLGDYWRDVAAMAGLISLFILALPFLGSLLTIFAFAILYLQRFNKGQLVFNVLYGATFSVAVFLLFEIALQAGLPKGLLAHLY